MNQKIVFLDLDETLVDKSKELISVNLNTLLVELANKDVTFVVSSRNTTYEVEILLQQFNLRHCFSYVCADFRPKKYHVRECLHIFKTNNFKISRVFFVDDSLNNCEQIRAIRGEYDAKFYIFNINTRCSLATVLKTIKNNNFSTFNEGEIINECSI